MLTPDYIEQAIAYSHNFATAKPDIGTTEREHILGLCHLLTKCRDAMAGGPVAWLVRSKLTGELEVDEPHAKATNPEYWTDAFPVYGTPPPEAES